MLSQQISARAGIAHNCGTVRFGTDPRTAALDVNCKAHDLDNLYVVNASFFPSSSAVNPGLTTIASALRVGDHLLERLGALPAGQQRDQREIRSGGHPDAPATATERQGVEP